MNPVEELYSDHERLVERLNGLEGLCRRAEGGAPPAALATELDAVADVLQEEINVHSNKEELALFPLLRRHSPPEGLLDKMLEEHESIRDGVHDFVAGVGAWLGGQAGSGLPWVGPARRVRGELSTHMQKENLMVFPLAKRVLTPEDFQELEGQFARLS